VPENTLNEQLNKRDLEVFLEVNRKSVEIETEVAEQNEEIISLLNDNKKKQDDLDVKVDKLIKQTEEINKDIFKIQVLFITGILSLVIQIIQMFIKK
jgi:hypothetical protein